MKSFNFQKLFTLILAFSLVANYGFAQEKQKEKSDDAPKKVIIIKKTIDKDGKEKTEKIIREGDELHELHFDDIDGKVIIEEIQGGLGKEIKVIVHPDDVDMDIEQSVKVNVEEINGEKHIKVQLKPMDGDEKVIEWKGDGDLPEDVQQKLKENGIFLKEMGDFEKGEKGVFFLHDEHDGQEFNWVSDGEPGPFLGVESARNAEVTVVIDEDGNEERTVSPADNEEEGVLIGGIVSESAAEAAGLQKGDILKSIDGQALNGFSDLVEFMQGTEIGQKVALTYERDGQIVQTEATLTERQAEHGNIIIDRIIEDEDMDKDGNVFIFQSDDEGGLEIHKRHNIVIITRGGEDDSKLEEIHELPAEILPETELDRSLSLRNLALFPNPTDGALRLRFDADALPTTVKVSDLDGKRLYRERLNRFDGQYDQNIDLSDLPAGIFLLTIEQGDKVYTEQIVVK